MRDIGGRAERLVGWLRRTSLAVAAAASVAIGGASGQGIAPNVDPSLKAEFEQAFQEMLRDPANLDKTFKYAELAVKVGDFEAAITALERMLLFNPDLPRVRLELGVLYFRLGSYAIARTYLTRALEATDVPPDVRERVQVYLDEIDKRMSPHQFAGSLYGGYRYQSNANAGPSSTGVTLFGFPATLSTDAIRHSDHNIFASANGRYVYDPGAQNGETVEATGTIYAARQFNQQQLDLLFFETTLGPRAPFMSDHVDNLSIHPYLVFDLVGLEDARYFYSYGLGMLFTKQWSDKFSTDLGFEYKVKDYHNSARRPVASQQDGPDKEIRINLRYLLTPDDLLTATPYTRWTSGRGEIPTLTGNGNAFLNIYSNQEVGGILGFAKTYDAPFGVTEERWTTSLNLSYAIRRYDETDPTIDPGNRRFDRDKRLNFLTAVPVTRDWSIIINLQRTIVDSSLQIYTYNNSLASIGASWKF